MRTKVLGGAVGALVVASGVVVATLLAPGSADAVTSVPITQSCEVAAPFTGDPFEISTTFSGTAPTSATAGSVFTATGTGLPWTVPSDINSEPVTQVVNYGLTIQVTGSATVVGDTISGGSNLGTGTPTVTRSGNNVTLNIPGPLTPGSIVQLPTINLTIHAGTAGTVSTQLAGTSYADPGVTITGTTQTGASTTTSPATCYPTTTPVLTSTLVH